MVRMPSMKLVGSLGSASGSQRIGPGATWISTHGAVRQSRASMACRRPPMGDGRADAIQPAALVARTRRGERRAAELFGIEPVGAALRRVSPRPAARRAALRSRGRCRSRTCSQTRPSRWFGRVLLRSTGIAPLAAGRNQNWRRGWDSNPRMGFTPINGLANRRLQPLGHPSAGVVEVARRCNAKGVGGPPAPVNARALPQATGLSSTQPPGRARWPGVPASRRTSA